MAFIPLMAAAASQGFDELLAQMAPNTPPTEPSVWPLAVGYWLILGIAVMAIGSGVYLWIKQRAWRTLQSEIKKVQTLPETQQLVRLHTLLRWLSIHYAQQPKEMSSAGFADWISQYNGGQTPDWVNAHYQPDYAAGALDWSTINKLVRAIYKEGRS